MGKSVKFFLNLQKEGANMSFCSFSKDCSENSYVVLENKFITKYLPEADGFAVKVYLYGLYLCSHGVGDFTLSSMAEVLKCTTKDLEKAFAFWEDYDLVQIISKNPFAVQYLPVKSAVGRPKKVRYEKYTDFNKETEKFNKFVTEFSPDFKTFLKRAVENSEKYRNESGFLPNQPKNTFDITCLPWTTYKSLDLHIYGDGKALFPIVMWGKYRKEGERILLPVTAMFHHAVCDGFALCRFFDELSSFLSDFRID